MTNAAYTELVERTREAALLGSSASLLGWDQETMMPPRGVAHRAKQLAQLARLTHEMSTDARVGELLSACEGDDAVVGDGASVAAVNVRELRRSYDRQTKLPASLVSEMTQTSAEAKAAWAEARKSDDYAAFEPWLTKLLELSRQEAACYGWAEDGEPWDALAEGYEPGCTAAEVAALFAPLRERLVGLVNELLGKGTPPANTFNEIALPVDAQERFVRDVAKQIGFDFEAGRLDRSTHPFCSGTHCRDIRMTTRFHDAMVGDALGSTMHESGHGIYEQGLLYEHVGTPMGSSVSLGIHESQSRMWENQVGRSEAFWKWCLPRLHEYFGDAVAGLDLATVYGGVNRVQRSLIRVEADEATYNLHIMVRFELERALIKGELNAGDLPGAWNERYAEYLGVDVPSDAKGCMQDIHWSMGAFGYFPTYTLGNLYAAQFFEAAVADVPGLLAGFEAGEFGPLKKWLNDKVHRYGQRYRAAELCETVTGKVLSAEPLMRHLEGKLRAIYSL